MGSAESSGVSDKGFGGTAGGLFQRASASSFPAPVLLVLVATLASAGFFVGNDIARSHAELEERAQLVAALAAAQIEPGTVSPRPAQPSRQPFRTAHILPCWPGRGGIVQLRTPTGCGVPAFAGPLRADDDNLVRQRRKPGRVRAEALNSGGSRLAPWMDPCGLVVRYHRDRPFSAQGIATAHRHASGHRGRSLRACAWSEDGRLVCTNPALHVSCGLIRPRRRPEYAIPISARRSRVRFPQGRSSTQGVSALSRWCGKTARW